MRGREKVFCTSFFFLARAVSLLRFRKYGSLSYLFLCENELKQQQKSKGNGYIATGAVFAGESTEFLFSPFFSKSLPPKAKAIIPFCLNGVNGGVPMNGNCETPTPPSP